MAVCVAVRSSVCCSSWQCVLQFVVVCVVLYLVYYHVHIYNILVVTEIVQIPSFHATNTLTWTFDFQTNAALATFWDPVFSSKKSFHQKRDFQHQNLRNFCWISRCSARNFLRAWIFVCVCCSVLQCVAVCCSVLQCVADRYSTRKFWGPFYECIMWHSWMCHVTRMNVSRHTYECVMSHICLTRMSLT